jgi:hypothetical protein
MALIDELRSETQPVARSVHRLMPPSAWRILREVSAETGFSVADLLGDRLARKLARARWEAWRRMRNEIVIAGNPPSYPQIGAWVGRDHNSIQWGLRGGRKQSERSAPVPRQPVAKRLFKCGHPWSQENMQMDTGRLRCRACNRAKALKWYYADRTPEERIV